MVRTGAKLTKKMEKFVTYDPIKKVWSGRKVNSIYNNEASVGYIILNVLKQTPERVTQVNHETNIEITCGNMYARSLKLANHLAQCCYKQGDIVGLISHNNDNVAPIIFACLALSLSINPLATTMNVDDMIHIYSMTRPQIIFVDSTVFEHCKGSSPSIENRCTNIHAFGSCGRMRIRGRHNTRNIRCAEIRVINFRSHF